MMRHIIRSVLDAIFPPKEDVIAARSLTAATLSSLAHPRAVKEAWIVSLFPYSDARVRSLILAVKFYGETEPLPFVGEIVSDILLPMVADRCQFSGWNVPLLIPIPASPARLKERGYNQGERFAESLLPFLAQSLEYAPRVLAREERQSQVRIAREKREENVRNAFFVKDPHAVLGRQVILFDDVVESGATMKDARRALRAAGASDVLGIALAN